MIDRRTFIVLAGTAGTFGWPAAGQNTKHRPIVGLPSMFEERFFVERGGLISYSTNLVDLFRRSGSYVARILDGSKPCELPVQLPTRFEMLVSQTTAKPLGLIFPPTILIRADEVLE